MSEEKNYFAKGVEWPVIGFMAVVHIVPVVLCILYPSWPGVVSFLILYLITGLGVTIGYHRKLTHSSFDSPMWVNKVLAVMGLLSGEGPPVFWVALHRKHHKFSDLEGDPHSPITDNFWWAHMLWIFPKQHKVKLGALYGKWAPDLVKVPFYQFLEKSYFFWHLGLLAIVYGTGYYYGLHFSEAYSASYMAMSFVAWGFFFRMIWVLHATWMVNSASHIWGYKNYKTTDESRNNPVVAVLAYGEGWHNNHHYTQSAVNHGHRWWEFDVSFVVIMLFAVLSYPLKWVGLGKYRLAYRLRFYNHKEGKLKTWFPRKKDKKVKKVKKVLSGSV